MDDERLERPRREPADNDLSRRAFVALSIGSGLAAATRPAGAALPVVESELTIETPDGSCDAAFLHPSSGAHPGVLIWPDAFGLRPALREMGRRLAHYYVDRYRAGDKAIRKLFKDRPLGRLLGLAAMRPPNSVSGAPQSHRAVLFCAATFACTGPN